LFETIAVAGQSNVVADSTTDTLTLVGAGATTITTTAGTDTITFTSTDTDTTDSLADAYNVGASGVAGAGPGMWDPGVGPPSTVAHAIDRLCLYLATYVAPAHGGARP
jgi:hypothetical protein